MFRSTHMYNYITRVWMEWFDARWKPDDGIMAGWIGWFKKFLIDLKSDDSLSINDGKEEWLWKL